MCIQYGLPETEQTDFLFPKWYHDIHLTFRRRTSTILSSMMLSRMQDHMTSRKYNYTQNWADRDWTGGKQSTCPTLENAAANKGISLFAMLNITDEEVALMMQDQFDINTATSTVTVTNVKKSKSKVKAAAVVPNTLEKFLAMLKRSAKLLWCALFSSQCPLYVQMYDLILALPDISHQTAY